MDSGKESAAAVLFQNPAIGVVLENISCLNQDMRVVQTCDSLCRTIFVNKKVLQTLYEVKDDE
jgi:hypothetical protein